MNINYLNFHDLTPKLKLPGEGELHLFYSFADAMDNLHKNLHEYSHALRSQILSLYTGIPENELEFGTGEHGKPYLRQREDIFFSMSHSGQYIVFLFSTSVPVGIDIEKSDRNIKTDRIADRMFLPEEAAYLRTLEGDEKKLQFFNYWTRTESFLKGIGTGLSVSFTDKIIQEEYLHWNTRRVTAPDGYVCTVAYRNPDSLCAEKTPFYIP